MRRPKKDSVRVFRSVAQAARSTARWTVGRLLAADGVTRLRGAQVAALPARVLDGRDGVFEDQLLLRARFQQDGELVEALDSA